MALDKKSQELLSKVLTTPASELQAVMEAEKQKVRDIMMAKTKEQLVDKVFEMGELLADGVLKLNTLMAENMLLREAINHCTDQCPHREPCDDQKPTVN